MTEFETTSAVAAFSDGLAAAVERAGRSVVLVDARRRFPATGIAWQAGGIIVTADHVLEREEDLGVVLPSGDRVPAVLLGREPGSDLAVLRVESDLPPAEQAPAARVGQVVLAVGRPEPSLMASFGVVSAVGGPWQTATGVQVDGFIRSDTTFYPGFSGGPLVDALGRVVGLNSSRLGRGSGLTVPATTVDRIVQALAQHGRVRRGYLGITTQPVTAAAAAGLLVVGVEAGCPADRGGILVGDIITGIGEVAIDSSTDLRRHLGPDAIGKDVTVRVVRGGEARALTVTIGERAASK